MSSTTRTAPAPAGPSRGRTVGPRVPAPPARRPRPLTPSRPLLLLAALLGLGSAALGAWLLRHPGSVLATDPEVFLVRAVLGAAATAVLLVVLGLLGTVAALLALRDRPAGHALLAVALIQLVAFGTALQSVTTISLAGYLAAAALLPAVVVLAGLVVRRYRRLRWLVLAAALGVVVAVAASWAGVSASLVRLGRALAGGFATAAPRLGVTVLTAAVLAVWLLVAVRLGRDSGAARTAGGWVQRHRVALTLVAAAGPLPYGLVRLTWLTPWPLLSPTTALPGELRLWGLLLGGAALVGTVLTLGLVLPYRWPPRSSPVGSSRAWCARRPCRCCAWPCCPHPTR